EHGDNLLQSPGRMVGPMCRAVQSKLFPREGNEQIGSPPRRIVPGEGSGQFQYSGGAAGVVVSPVVNLADEFRYHRVVPPQSQVVVVSSKHDGFVGERRVLSRQEPDYVAHFASHPDHVDFQAHGCFAERKTLGSQIPVNALLKTKKAFLISFPKSPGQTGRDSKNANSQVVALRPTGIRKIYGLARVVGWILHNQESESA